MHCGNTRHLIKHRPRLLTAQSLPVDVVECSGTVVLIFVAGLCTDFVATVINPCCQPVHQALRRSQFHVLGCAHRSCVSAQIDLSTSFNSYIASSACAGAVGDSTRTGSLDLFDRYPPTLSCLRC